MAVGGLFTIGSGGFSQAEVVAILRRLRVGALIDVRGIPRSRKPGFAGSALARAWVGYEWRGQVLGNKGAFRVTTAGLDMLADRVMSGERMALLCAESAPGDCHRHILIARPLIGYGVDATHIFRAGRGEDIEQIKASMLDLMLYGDADSYPYAPLTLRPAV